MKRLVIVIGLVLLLAGGVAGWWFFVREDPAAGRADAPPDAGVVLTEKFIDLDPFLIPILREGRVTQHLTVVLTVELDGPVPADSLLVLMPRLRDAILRELHGVFAFRHVQDAGQDMPIVKQRLIGAAERVFGAGAVKAILVKASSKRAPDSG